MSSTRDFDNYLRKLKARSTEVSHSISKLDFRQGPPSWPVCIKRFSVLSSQIDALYTELYGEGDSLPELAISERTVLQPTVHGFDPSHALRVKDITEIEQQEEQNVAEYLEDHPDASTEVSQQLADRIDQWNNGCSSLSAIVSSDAEALRTNVDEQINFIRTRPPESSRGNEDLQNALRCMLEGRLVRRAVHTTVPVNPSLALPTSANRYLATPSPASIYGTPSHSPLPSYSPGGGYPSSNPTQEMSVGANRDSQSASPMDLSMGLSASPVSSTGALSGEVQGLAMGMGRLSGSGVVHGMGDIGTGSGVGGGSGRGEMTAAGVGGMSRVGSIPSTLSDEFNPMGRIGKLTM